MWKGMQGMVPLRRRANWIAEPAAVAAAEDLGESTSVDSAGVRQWWAGRTDEVWLLWHCST